MALTDKLSAIADAIRGKLNTTDLIPLSEIPAKVDNVYDAGRKIERDSLESTIDSQNNIIAEQELLIANLQNEIENSFDEGKQEQWSIIWDAIQNKGLRTDYSSAFNNSTWDNTSFKPKYNMKPIYAPGIISNSGIEGDLREVLKNANVSLDFSECTRFDNAFKDSKITHVGIIDLSNVTASYAAANIFYNAKFLVEIEKLISTDKIVYNGTFFGCNELEILIVEGIIAENGFNVEWSTKLSKESILSIINALSSETTGLTVTISKTAKENAFTEEEWETIIATKPNWNIKLI